MSSLTTSYVKMARMNPFHFHLYGTGDFYANTIPYFEEQKGFCQLMHWNQNVYFQFMSLDPNLEIGGADGSYCTLRNNEGTLIGELTDYTIERLQTLYRIGQYYVYCVHGNLPVAGSVEDGIYFLQLSLKMDTDEYWILYSEPLNIKELHDHTIIIEYEHTENDFDIIWTDAKSQQMFIEIEGGMKSDGITPSGKHVVYSDLQQRPQMLNSIPFNVYKWTFGGSLGIPNWMIDKINRALSCDKFYINNVQYMRVDGAKLERSGDDAYPLASWSIDMMKADNEQSIEFNKAGIGVDGKWSDRGVWEDNDTWTDLDIINISVDVEVGETAIFYVVLLPISPAGAYTNGTIDWGDGSPIETIEGTFFTYEYGVAGEYDIILSVEKGISQVFTFDDSHITSIDMSLATDLDYISVLGNYLTEEAMTSLIESMMDRTGLDIGYYQLVPQEATFLQDLTAGQLAMLTAKNYEVYIPK